MRHRLTLPTILMLVITATACRGPRFEETVHAIASDRPDGFSAPGRIEGSSEPIEIGAAIDGVIEAVLVGEGDQVAAGQVLARISCDDIAAAFAVAEADARAWEMRLTILRNGTRKEDLDLAHARTAAALAVRRRAEQFHERVKKLWDEKVISDDELDRAGSERDAAVAGHEAALAEERRADAGPLPEEIAEAGAQLDRGRLRALELRNRHARCEVRAPMSGTVLKRLLLPGESVSAVFPRPILTLANLNEWTVRAEVDEHDITRVGEAMPVVVTSPAWGQTQHRGRVKAVAHAMGRRRVRSGDPAEKSDRDIREVIVDLDGGGFVVGLRVDVLFDPDR